MKKILQKICIFLCVIALLPLSACSNAKVDAGNTIVWSAYGTEKILYDLDYSNRYNEKNLNIYAFRNEYESAQIVISADATAKYTVKVGKLVNDDGVELEESAISLYHEKLTLLEKITDKGVNTPPGYYPDALLPYEKAVEYGENTVEKGKNRAIWVEVHASETQPAGVYKGSCEVKVANKTYSVPTSVTIYDYTLSDTTQVKSLFCVSYDWMAYAELDSTKAMADAYYDFFLEYRLAPSDFPCALNSGYSAYADNTSLLNDIVKAAKDPRCSVIRIPTIADTGLIEYDNEYGEHTSLSIARIAYAPYKQFILDIAKRSVEENLNIFEKAYTYMTICDEYDDVGKPNGWVYAKFNHNLLKSYNVELAQTILDTLENTNPDLSNEDFETLKSEIAQGVLGIKNILTGVSINPILNSPYPGEDPDVVFCPTIESYSTQGARDELDAYASQSMGETWAYTCVNPQSPYPTYHVDDDLISARMLNWMMYEYNISGNLYWSSTGYHNFGQSEYFQIQDYYQAPLRYPNMNGDGYLVYPGRQYGIKGPVPSIRIKAIRDGNEDYDLLYALEDFYKQYGCTSADFDSVLKYMTGKLYNGTKCNLGDDDNANMQASRKLLAELLLLSSNTGSVLKRIDSNKNVVTVQVIAPQGVTLAIDGATVVTQPYGDKTLHTFTFSLLEKQTLKLTATANGKDYTVKINLGLPALLVETTNITQKISSYKSSVTVTATDGEISGTPVSQVIVVDEQNGKPAFEIDTSAWNIDEKCSRVVFNVYYEGEDINYTATATCKFLNAFLEITKGKLTNGWNKIELSLANLNCATNGNVVKIRLSLTGENKALLQSPLTLSLSEIVLEG